MLTSLLSEAPNLDSLQEILMHTNIWIESPKIHERERAIKSTWYLLKFVSEQTDFDTTADFYLLGQLVALLGLHIGDSVKEIGQTSAEAAYHLHCIILNKMGPAYCVNLKKGQTHRGREGERAGTEVGKGEREEGEGGRERERGGRERGREGEEGEGGKGEGRERGRGGREREGERVGTEVGKGEREEGEGGRERERGQREGEGGRGRGGREGRGERERKGREGERGREGGDRGREGRERGRGGRERGGGERERKGREGRERGERGRGGRERKREGGQREGREGGGREREHACFSITNPNAKMHQAGVREFPCPGSFSF
ncbi:maestro heat-like repeat family member 5 [Crotalus adamanteus]|uniref:Maestro heat-like repeat family member 5 n=1 Tax=Crotalus adamanteus TaxID=8729 RepID=A0AAW1APW5_CROAD